MRSVLPVSSALPSWGMNFAGRRPTISVMASTELRARLGRLNFRLLSFFHGQLAAILAHGLTKEDKVPEADIDRAIRRKERFLKQPAAHTYEEALTNGEDA